MAIHPVDEINERYQITTGFKKRGLKKLTNNPKTSVIQFSSPLTEKEIEALEEFVFAERPDITLRVFGHYMDDLDLNFLKRIPSLRSFSADSLRKTKGIEVLTGLKGLESLTIGIYELDNFDFLDGINPGLKQLSLHRTQSKKPSIDKLTRFVNLEELYLEGHFKGIASVNSLKKLKKITLRSISTPDLNYLTGLEELWSVDIKLGSIKNFDALSSLPNLKYLEMWQVRGLTDLSFVANLTALQNLFLQSLPDVKELPNLDRLYKLRRIYLENMKGLQKLDPLKTAPTLKDFVYVMAQNQKLENLYPVLENECIEAVSCGFGSSKKNEQFNNLAKKFRKKEYEYTPFIYR
ncbi:hypothetical protein KHS38_15180 [Mucilaginibacter sp. Bleaf8]|uniref:hypothetical protein n=1 Tax=Mucilaginibacter sp. Bleaf8 TaxID=2834430 RepID=UPI001BCAEC09|nr:hypothetical protein [Mucilaginibacter sp. Bleaf8]MBS7565750.1 hypothetical protein [Mucilaginibacter sp. Bleaf8]